MGSAGVKVMSVVRDVADAYVHAGGQYEWDNAAPVAVARAAGLFCSRVDGSELRYNQDDVSLPDLIVCRPGLADADPAVRQAARHRLSRAMIRHVLLDADGVVQDLPGGWRAALEPFLGDALGGVRHRPGDGRAGLPARGAVPAGARRPAGPLRGRSHGRRGVRRCVGADRGATRPSSRWRTGCGRVASASTWPRTRTPSGRRTCGASWGTPTGSTRSSTPASWGWRSPRRRTSSGSWRPSPPPPTRCCSSTTRPATWPAPATAGLAAEQWHLDDGLPRLHELLAAHGLDWNPDRGAIDGAPRLARLAAMTSYISHTTVDCAQRLRALASGGRTCSATSTSPTTPTSPGTRSA